MVKIVPSQNKFYPPLKNLTPGGITEKRGGGAIYFITKERLVIASALYALNENYFHQGQKLTI